jgi:hypothetical protein
MKFRPRSATEWSTRHAMIFVAGLALMAAARSDAQAIHQATSCTGDFGGITLAPGFCATVFADKLGNARHIVAAPNGVLYVNTRSAGYNNDDIPPPGGFLIALMDTTGNGHADKAIRFGPTPSHRPTT